MNEKWRKREIETERNRERERNLKKRRSETEKKRERELDCTVNNIGEIKKGKDVVYESIACDGAKRIRMENRAVPGMTLREKLVIWKE